jgi:serine/threonine protein kinase
MELMDHSLLKNINSEITDSRLENKEVVLILIQAISALKRLHEKRIIYRSMTPTNVLVKNRVIVKLADFGISRRASGTRTMIGTLNLAGYNGYVAPELIDQIVNGPINSSFTFNKETDIYSFGILIADLVLNQFGGKRSQSRGGRMSDSVYHIEEVKGMASERGLNKIGEIYEKCVERNPMLRASTGEILRDLVDLYFELNWS